MKGRVLPHLIVILIKSRSSDESIPDWSWIPDSSFKNDILKVVGFGQTCSNMHLLDVYRGKFRIVSMFSRFWAINHFHHGDLTLFAICLTEFEMGFGFVGKTKAVSGFGISNVYWSSIKSKTSISAHCYVEKNRWNMWLCVCMRVICVMPCLQANSSWMLDILFIYCVNQ